MSIVESIALRSAIIETVKETFSRDELVQLTTPPISRLLVEVRPHSRLLLRLRGAEDGIIEVEIFCFDPSARGKINFDISEFIDE